MASLNDLPNELLDNILARLDSRDALRLSMTCKSMRAAALPTAYRSIVMKWINGPVPESPEAIVPRIHALLRTLLKSPELVKLVRSLDFRAEGCVFLQDEGEPRISVPQISDEITQEDQSLFADAIEALQLPDFELCKVIFVQQPGEAPIIQMLLLAYCTQLTSISFAIEFLMESDWIAMFVENTVTAPRGHPLSGLLKTLTEVRVTSDTEGYIWSSDYTVVLMSILRLFYLPCVETLVLTSFVDDNEEGVLWRDEENPFRWPLRTPPWAEKLTHLQLLRSSISPELIDMILQQTPNLHTFDYECIKYPDSGCLDLPLLRGALGHVRNTLTTLIIRYEIYDDEEEGLVAQDTFSITEGSLGPFDDFPVLTDLITSMAVLFGSDVITMGRTPRLADFLPPKLQRLTLTDDLWLYPDFQQCFEGVDAMAILRTYFTGEKINDDWDDGGGYDTRGGDNWGAGKCYSRIRWHEFEQPGWKTATPELRSFTYDLRERGDKSFAYWTDERPREELKAVVQAQGIECEVLFDE
ncbi:hypothetical protein IQ07DRAFT_586135 [Pyrenochaeta sp. DS3sAY3a]|nr:hypothetical protein IQ07DRAFT_586135 [Pyrenochaeta sp. DS3sAY3a]